MKACQFWQQDIWVVYVMSVRGGQVSGSAVFSVFPCKWERPQSGTGLATRREQIQELRCPIMSEKTIICLRCSSLRNTFEVERREAGEHWKLSTKSHRRHLLSVMESKRTMAPFTHALLSINPVEHAAFMSGWTPWHVSVIKHNELIMSAPVTYIHWFYHWHRSELLLSH